MGECIFKPAVGREDCREKGGIIIIFFFNLTF